MSDHTNAAIVAAAAHFADSFADEYEHLELLGRKDGKGLNEPMPPDLDPTEHVELDKLIEVFDHHEANSSERWLAAFNDGYDKIKKIYNGKPYREVERMLIWKE